MKKNKKEIITRIIIAISALGAIVGCLIPMLTINLNIMGKNLYSQNLGVLSLANIDKLREIIDKINSLGLLNMDGMGEKLLKVMILPISLYLATTLLVIFVMISAMVNKFNRLRMLLSITATVIEVCLISVLQELPSKLMQLVSLDNTSGKIDWSKFFEINLGIGHWIVLVAIIIMTTSTICYLIIFRSKGSGVEM